MLEKLVALNNCLHEKLVEKFEDYDILRPVSNHLELQAYYELISDRSHALQLLKESILVSDTADDDLAHGLHHVLIDADLAINSGMPWAVIVEKVA